MQNFWSKQLNAIKQDSFHINDESSLIKQLQRINQSFSRKKFYADQSTISINDSNTTKDFRFIEIWVQNF
jgi:hypothetical protein